MAHIPGFSQPDETIHRLETQLAETARQRDQLLYALEQAQARFVELNHDHRGMCLCVILDIVEAAIAATAATEAP